MKKFLSITVIAIIALAGAYGLGTLHTPEPEKVEVVKIVEKEVVKTIHAVEKTAKTKNTSIRQVAKDGTVTETNVAETELQDKALEEFITAKLKQHELVKEVYNEWKQLYGASAGLDRNKNLTADLEYGRFIGKVFDRPVFAKAELNLKGDYETKVFMVDGGKVGGFVLLN